MKRSAQTLLAVLLVLAAVPEDALSQNTTAPITGGVPCVDGQAAGFGCRNVDLLSFLPISAITGGRAQAGSGGAFTAHAVMHPCNPAEEQCKDDEWQGEARLNDIWGWTDPATGKEYAIVGRTDGTAFVDISVPTDPVYLGTLPTHSLMSVWRDIKVYKDHAYIVADNAGPHGMQVFDLRQLRSVESPPVVFSETAHYPGFENAHNIFINEQSGFAYAVGTNTFGGGLHIVNVSDPASPVFAGSFVDARTGRQGTGYTHDVQCVNYAGPDARYQGREICFGSNETALSIADVTDKAAPTAISLATYPDVRYAHQGWLTEDHRYFLVDDELDEFSLGIRTRTIVWDVSDLQNPRVHAIYSGVTGATDHNQYVVDGFSFQANYTSGLRIIDVSRIASAGSDATALRESGYFDSFPANDDPGFEGAWSNYPFFESGVVVVSSMGQGLFVLKPNLETSTGMEAPDASGRLSIASAYPNPLKDRGTLVLDLPQASEVRAALYDVLGREVAVLYEGRLSAGRHAVPVAVSGVPSGRYVARLTGGGGVDTEVVTVVR